MGRAIRLILFAGSISSLAVNWVWVNLPFSSMGLKGRQSVLFGDLTLLQTLLLPHPYLALWVTGFLLQAASTSLFLLTSVGSKRYVGILLISSGVVTTTLIMLIMWRWLFSFNLVAMYALGLLSGLTPIVLGLIHLIWSRQPQ
ncbi:hypothetical protein HRbin02_01128 [Candidatus Calditenuaceae archaeon HR02]|nr:hypothetical protein HRbin02_01128 [Candidatus Calditenuaceae archaeon HR02]